MWSINISPRQNEETLLNEIETKTGTMLTYNPTVSIVVRTFKKGSPPVALPIDKTYQLEDILSLTYNGLSTKGMYKRDGKRLYIDANLALANTHKISCYTTSLIFIPVVLSLNEDTPDSIGVSVQSNGESMGILRPDELEALIGILSHLDVKTYILVASLLEKLAVMDNKLDAIYNMQMQIFDLLMKAGFSSKDLTQQPQYYVPPPKPQISTPINDFDWTIV